MDCLPRFCARPPREAFKSSCSMNCLSPKLLVLPSDEVWPQRSGAGNPTSPRPPTSSSFSRRSLTSVAYATVDCESAKDIPATAGPSVACSRSHAQQPESV
ncbi:unnamed protein product [Polarella glacialis]|uniref:Uncharacterized protein n=1 Tax=Polarella glacialis TaxID=89957 RepID=A0A813DJI0_POLGL|nr:unnamed protein product [Polarella glacialis]